MTNRPDERAQRGNESLDVRGTAGRRYQTESTARKSVGRPHAGRAGLEGHHRKKLVTPTARRSAVGYLQTTYQFSQRRACRLAGAHRRTMRYRRRMRPDELRLRERLRALASERPRFGYRRLPVLLKREEGQRHPINHKRVYRLYRAEGLTVRRHKRKRVTTVPIQFDTTNLTPRQTCILA